MKEKISKIMADCSIRDVGFCDFEHIGGQLLACRAQKRLPENARTVIVCIFPYKVHEEPPQNISRYAAVPDYHKVCGEYLQRAADALKREFPTAAFEPFTDNSPIPEVSAAASAGLGVIGKNGLLITPKYGSFVFIGEIVTDLYIPSADKTEHCSLCGACERACPVGLDKSRCLSALSQKKGELEKYEAALLRENGIVWGCDICAEACPMNKGAQKTEIPEFISGYRNQYTEREDITGRAYEWRGEKTVLRNSINLK